MKRSGSPSNEFHIQQREKVWAVEVGFAKASRFVAFAAEAVIIAFTALMTILVFIQVVARYGFNSALGWSEELSLILIIWLTFVGTIVIGKRNQWITIDALMVFLSPKIQEHISVVIQASSIAFCVHLVKEGLELTLVQKDMVTAALEVSYAWIYASVPISAFFLGIQLFASMLSKVRERPSALVSLFLAAALLTAMSALLPSVRPLLDFPTVLLASMLMLFLLGMPVAIALGITAMIFFLAKGESVFIAIPQNMTWGVNSFPLMAIPFFLLAGELMNKGGVTIRLIRFASTLVGHIRGGMGHVAVVANLIMAGMSGSEVADAAATGSILIPSMKEKAYKAGFAAAIVASASVIGPIFPPSVPFVIYGALANTSVLKLFLAGAVPGIIMAVFLMGAVYLIARKEKYPREERASLPSLILSFKQSILALLMPVIIIGGMLAGVFTPTEAAAVGVMYALALGLISYKEINGNDLIQALSNVAIMTSNIMYIVATASVIGWIAAREQIPQALTQHLYYFGRDPWIVLSVINIILLVLGAFISSIPIMLIMIPVLAPVVGELHIDPVHFGVVFSLNVMLGLNTPPFGMAMFLVCRIAGISIVDFTKNWWPFFCALLLVLILVTYVPGVTMWLPNLLVK